MTLQEKQYNKPYEDFYAKGAIKLGFITSYIWRTDPKHMAFLLSRYKFVAKLLSGCRDVLEIGCGDGFGAELVLQEVERIHCVDFDAKIIQHCLKERPKNERLSFAVADLSRTSVTPRRDAAYAIDVFEHVAKKDEQRFIGHVAKSLKPQGICIIGTPSLESQVHASRRSRAGHVNCKSGDDLKALLKKFFNVVFLFSMNDEVVHTGFSPMAHYLMAVCVGPKQGREIKHGS